MQILLATCGSPHSEAALRFGAQTAHCTMGTLTLLTVIQSEASRPLGDDVFSHAKGILGSAVLDLHTKIRIGHPAEEIIREAEEGGYNLVIVGVRQRRRLVSRFLLGSTAVRVVEHAPCPVVIAKGEIGPVERILLCDSGADNPSLLSRFIEQLACIFDGDQAVTVLHVMSQMSAGPGVLGEDLRANAAELVAAQTPEGELLTRDARLLEKLRIRPQLKVRHGRVVDEILAEMQDGDYNLAVIGAHRGKGWRRILLDDLAHQIITQVDRPVLVVR